MDYNSTVYVTETASAGLSIGYVLALLLVAALMIVAMWKIFVKAGEEGWKAIIPFYNTYILYKITWGNGWFFLFGFLPLGNIVFLIFTWIKLAKAFGKGGGYAAGLFFLPFIFLPMLGFGRAVYQGPDQGSNKGLAIACGVLGGLGILLYGALIVIGVTAGVVQEQNVQPSYVDENDDYDNLYDDYDDLYDDYSDSDDYSDYDNLYKNVVDYIEKTALLCYTKS